MHNRLIKIAVTVTFAALVWVGGAGADDIKLPDMGSPADAILSANEEARFGRAIMRDIMNSGSVIEDPLV
ncbi:MAG: M48 family peptidase, partial [Gammaproteobacteria bacterium]|nr:M48 family peptidase [Gammaproteobacteria bacterium]